jgi:hypothetical protein
MMLSASDDCYGGMTKRVGHGELVTAVDELTVMPPFDDIRRKEFVHGPVASPGHNDTVSTV